MKKYKLAIVGATGLVGRTVLKVLEEKKLPISEYKLFASKKSKGHILQFMNQSYIINELNESSFDEEFDFVIFATCKSISNKYVPMAVSKGSIVIDNSSAFRMYPDVPLIVPEVNYNDIKNNSKIISNPNCSTIQAVTVLKPLYEKYGIKRIVYSTYQAVSGGGKKGIIDLENGIRNHLTNKCYLVESGKNDDIDFTFTYSHPLSKFYYPIFSNCLPHIDEFLESGYTKEEEKMINETKKILKDSDLNITATCVRVPVFNCHSESINIEFNNSFNLQDVILILRNSPGVVVLDDISNNIYPTALKVSGSNKVYVGRIRRDFSIENGLNLWVVADNLRKGAATNAIQILEKLCI